MVQIFALIVLLFWIISRIRRSSKLFTGMVALFAIFVIVGAGVKKAIADSKAKSDVTTVVVSDDESSNANTFGAFDSLKNSQIIAPEGYVSINKPTSTTETTIPTSEETEILSNDRASPNALDSS